MTAGADERAGRMPRARARARLRPGGGDLAALLVVGALLRIGAILTIGDATELHGDPREYVTAARSLTAGSGFPGTARPPGYPAFLALALWAGGDALVAARLAQGALGLACIALVFDLVRRRFGRRAARISGLVVALDPTLVHYAHFLWAETLVAAVLLAAVWMADRWQDDRRVGWLVGVGLALGAGALTKEVVLSLAAIFAVWVLAISAGDGWRAALGRAAVVVAALAAVVLPWTARNVAVQERLVLISTARWVPIAHGLLNDPAGGERRRALARELRDGLLEQPDEIAREAFARQVAIAALRDAPPSWFAARLWDGPRKLFSAETQIGRFLRSGWLDPVWGETVRRLVLVEVVFFAASAAAGLVGLWLVPGPRVKSLVVAILLFHVAVHTIAVSTSRYRVPLLPLLALWSGPLCAGRAVLGGPGAALRALGALACVAWLAAAVASTSRRALALDRPAGRAGEDRTAGRAAGQVTPEPFDSVIAWRRSLEERPRSAARAGTATDRTRPDDAPGSSSPRSA